MEIVSKMQLSPSDTWFCMKCGRRVDVLTTEATCWVCPICDLEYMFRPLWDRGVKWCVLAKDSTHQTKKLDDLAFIASGVTLRKKEVAG